MDFEQINLWAQKLRSALNINCRNAIALGTGSSVVLEQLELSDSIPLSEIIDSEISSFHSVGFSKAHHKDKECVILSGRLHYYEGYSAKEITLPIRILQCMGISELLMTNAAGSLNASYQAGEIILVKDHINLIPDNPLRGLHEDRWGVRFPDMSNAYDAALRLRILNSWATHNGHVIKEGVYASFPGPSLETPAEYKFLKTIGADLIGMSTVPEVIVANHAGMAVAVLSIVTNNCHDPENITATTVEDVISVAEASSLLLLPIIKDFISDDLK